VRTNTTITLWRRRIGATTRGEPDYADSSGAWPILAEASRKTLKRGTREVVARLKVLLHTNPGIREGDKVVVMGEEYEVLDFDHLAHPVLAHDVLFLG